MNFTKINGQNFLDMVLNASYRLEENRAYVDSLNVFPVPDGDTGTNMSMTFTSAVESIIDSKEKNIGIISKNLAKGALMGARGNSGVILSQIFRGISKGLENIEEATPTEFALALKEGANSAYRAVMRPTEGTILTVIKEVGNYAIELHEEDVTILLEKVCKVGEDTLNKTPELLPQLKAAKVVDSGGMGLLIILKGMYEALKDGVKKRESNIKESSGTSAESAQNPEDIKFGYCTEFIVSGAINDPSFKDYLESKGDSIVFVTMDDVTKIHIHTENPGEVMQNAQKHGELLKIKIENMREQNRKLQKHEESDFVEENIIENKESYEATKELKESALICCSVGDGLKEIFNDLGCDYIIEGGQTMNPSTQDILNAIEKVNAKNIFIFPNNKNIIMSANQAKEITDKNLIVIPTKTIPQGISCISVFNPEESIENNEIALNEAIKTVKSMSVTYAVRDTQMDGVDIKQGDFLGLIEGKIKVVKRDLYEVANELLNEVATEDDSVISIYYGKDVKNEEVNNFVNDIQSKFSDFDVISYDGKQPIYYLIMSVE